MNWQGAAVGVLSLLALETLVSANTANKNVGGLLSGLGKAAQKFLDPTIPAFGTVPSSAPGTLGPLGATPASATTPPATPGTTLV